MVGGGERENMVRKFTKLIKTDSIIHFASKGRAILHGCQQNE
jgi:hypothetical protein